MHTAKAQMGVCVLKDSIYIAGENDIEKYNPEINSFVVLNVDFQTRYLSVLVPRQNSLLIFRGDLLNELEPKPVNDQYFIVGQLRKIEW